MNLEIEGDVSEMTGNVPGQTKGLVDSAVSGLHVELDCWVVRYP